GSSPLGLAAALPVRQFNIQPARPAGGSSLRPESRADALPIALPHRGRRAQCAQRIQRSKVRQVSVHITAIISFLRPMALAALTNSRYSKELIEVRSIVSMPFGLPLEFISHPRRRIVQ